ncbi:MAG: (2Fe-2S) ferredoxin domain-containing protein, partial [Leptospiraceae bacterium]|nr:(2Fe-2S) ferredoxin domain-containing protein [Leptospiraceae bacterium]
MSYYDYHIFVCENVREEGKRVSCGGQNSKEIREKLKLLIKELAPNKKIRVNMSGCLDRCEEGPVQVCYPKEIWLSLKSEEDIRLFVENYILNQNEDSIT